jgi:hypothetical protein
MLVKIIVLILGILIIGKMVLRLPNEAALIRALDTELRTCELCDQGDSEACELLDDTDDEHDLKKKVHTATGDLPGMCLFLNGSEVAIRTQDGYVSNVTKKLKNLI